MRQVLLDINVLLDAMLDRPPLSKAAVTLWHAVESGRVKGMVAAHGITTAFYLLARARGAPFARQAVGSISAVFTIAGVDGAVVRRALALGWPDFEDAVVAASAEAAGCDLLVTRDPKGFLDSPVPVVDPLTALSLLSPSSGSDEVSERRARYSPKRGPRRRRRGDRSGIPA